MKSRRIKQRTAPHRTGMAMMLVIPAVALAAVLSYAVLASTGTQEQISANAALIAQADCLAESGINYAIYNLQNPSTAPANWVGVPTFLTTNGSFTVTVAPVSSSTLNACTIKSTGNIGSISRTITAVVSIYCPVGAVNQAAGFNSITLNSSCNPLSVSGNLLSSGAFNAISGAVSVSGTLQASSVSGTVSATSTVLSAYPSAAPATTTIFTSYYLDGTQYYATNLTTDPAPGTTLGPTPTNPAGVYYSTNQNRTLSGVTINGTLIVKGNGSTTGGVIIGASSTNTITPMPGFPALMVDNTIKTNGNNSAITINGVAWAAKGITQASASNTGSSITVNGSLLIPSTSSSAISAYKQALSLTYNANTVNVPNFSSQSPTPTMQIVSWQNYK